jgi:hypothetical protein
MPKISRTNPVSVINDAVRLQDLAASVHNYDSFGRSIVASILSEAARKAASGEESPIQTTISILPSGHTGQTFFRPGSGASGPAAGTGASGPASETSESCIVIYFSIGSDRGHFYKLCLTS